MNISNEIELRNFTNTFSFTLFRIYINRKRAVGYKHGRKRAGIGNLIIVNTRHKAKIACQRTNILLISSSNNAKIIPTQKPGLLRNLQIGIPRWGAIKVYARTKPHTRATFTFSEALQYLNMIKKNM
jgi:hypothetical protein